MKKKIKTKPPTQHFHTKWVKFVKSKCLKVQTLRKQEISVKFYIIKMG